MCSLVFPVISGILRETSGDVEERCEDFGRGCVTEGLSLEEGTSTPEIDMYSKVPQTPRGRCRTNDTATDPTVIHNCYSSLLKVGMFSSNFDLGYHTVKNGQFTQRLKSLIK